MNRIFLSISVGILPGIILILLTIPIRGEHELTFGVLGIWAAIAGLIIGLVYGLRKSQGKLAKNLTSVTKTSQLLAIALAILIFAAGFWLGIEFQRLNQQEAAITNNFEQCAAAGYPVAESNPRQCIGPDGLIFIE